MLCGVAMGLASSSASNTRRRSSASARDCASRSKSSLACAHSCARPPGKPNSAMNASSKSGNTGRSTALTATSISTALPAAPATELVGRQGDRDAPRLAGGRAAQAGFQSLQHQLIAEHELGVAAGGGGEFFAVGMDLGIDR